MIPHTCTPPPAECFGCKIKTLQLRSRTAFQPHYNYSVGAYVDTESSFKDLLKRHADHASVYTGTEHSYEMRDPGDLKDTPYPQEDEILNTQARTISEQYAS